MKQLKQILLLYTAKPKSLIQKYLHIVDVKDYKIKERNSIKNNKDESPQAEDYGTVTQRHC